MLRDYQGKDFDTLWRIDQECFPPGIAYSRAELSAYMRARGAFTLVAERSLANSGRKSKGDSAASEPEILGFILAEISRGGNGHIITIDVLPKGRRLGVGSALLVAAEERLRDTNCGRIRLEAAIDNAAALAFYKRHGYAEVRTIPGYYSNGVDALVMEKRLH